MPGVARSSGIATSADGTVIAFDSCGSGPIAVLVDGAFTDRTHPVLADVAATLAPWFTMVNYDRRGRGASGDTSPYAAEREVEDLCAVIAAAGGPAMIFGGSSGAALALATAVRNPAITRLALWEPPYHVDDTAPVLPDDFAERLSQLVAQGRRADAVELFMVAAAEVPPATVATMRTQPSWSQLEQVAHTLAYEAAVMGPGNALPTTVLRAVRQPTLVLNGERSPGWMVNAGIAVATAISDASHRVLQGQTHGVSPKALAPELLEYFTTG